MSRQSRSVASSGASNSYSRSARSPLTGSNRQTLRAIFIVLVRSLLRLPLRDRDRLPLQVRCSIVPRDQRVAHEVLVVALRVVVGPRVCASALLPGEPGHDHALGELEHEAELERLREVRAEDVTLRV